MQSVAVNPSPPHAPARSLAAHVLGRFHVTGSFWYRFHRWGVTHAPPWSVAPLIHLFTAFFFLALQRIRRAVAANLVPVLGPAGFWETQRRIHRTLLEFAWCLTERYEHLSGVDAFEIEVESLEAWRTVQATASGFLVLTAHLGSWEVAASRLAPAGGRRVHLVREEELDPEAQAFVRGLIGRRAGEDLVTHFAGDLLLGAALLEALRRGEIVALQGDRPRTGGRTVIASLFGRPFDLPLGPLALARAAGVPILPTFAFREGRRRYRIACREPLAVARTAERGADLAAAAARVAADVEWAIRRAPFQWFCFGAVWAAGGSGSR